MSRVTQLIEHGAKINLKEKHGFSALMLAELMEYKAIKDKLVEHGAIADTQVDYNKKGTSDMTLLMSAIASKKWALVNKLIDNGVDIHVKNKYDQTAFHYAVLYGQTKIAQKLIDHVAKINEGNNHGDTPLMQAAQCGYLDLFDLVLKNNANFEAKNNFGQTVLDILSNSFMYNPNPEKNILDKEMIFKLIDADANIHEKDNSNRTPLQKVESSPELHDAMLARATQKEQKTLENKRLSFLPLKNNTEKMFKRLIEQDNAEELIALIKKNNNPINKLCIKDEDENQCSLLMHACELGKVKVVKSLLDMGAKINKQDQDGDTALAYAVDCEEDTQKDILHLLLSKGADVRLRNHENETAIDRAREYVGNDDVIKLLESSTYTLSPNK